MKAAMGAKKVPKGSKRTSDPGTRGVRPAKRAPAAPKKPALPGAAKRASSAGAKPHPAVKDASRAAALPTPAQAAARRLEQVIFSSINKIAAERNVDRLMLLLANFGRDLIGADRCTVWLCNQKDGTLWTKVAHGLDRMSIPKTKGLAGWVATHGEPLIINDPYRDERFDQEVDKQTGYRTRSILSLPILDADGRISGVYQAVNKLTGGGGFSEEDKEHLLLASTYTAEVLKTAQMQEEVEATQREIIFTMAEAGELRSKETGRHVKRVAEYCRLFAERYGLSETETEVLKLSSPMHDIGKIAIPDAVLLKPAKLDEAEWRIMKTHSTLGHDMLKYSDRRLLRSAAIIAWQHHEKWDGTGYPCGIAGTAIDIYARIAALADVFDALASDRPYKKAWELERIVKLFGEERERHFDPDLARIFLENVDAFVKIRNLYKDEAEQSLEPSSCPDH
jgi:HD-GYP domain-containing protein (c-di-GMP phosphodiesterase class II)